LNSELHAAVTIGTANGLSLSTQALSLAANSSTSAGAVTSGAGQVNRVWKTNAGGVPDWRIDENSGSGYTNLISFIDQTSWRLFYSNTNGDVTELALGANGTYLRGNGTTAAPTWGTPSVADNLLWIYPQNYATGTGTSGDPWAGDCLDDAYTACPTGGTIFLRTGYYLLDNALMITKAINIIGEGINKTIVVTANAHGFDVRGDYVTIKNLTIDGDAQSDAQEWLSCISVNGVAADVNYLTIENVEVKNAGMSGIDFFEANHSSVKNLLTHDNYEHGIHPGSNKAKDNNYNTYQNIYAWNNGWYGFYDRGNSEHAQQIEYCYNTYDNINAWNNGYAGIGIEYQMGGVLSNSFATSNTGSGIQDGIKMNYLENFIIQDCNASLNGTYGVSISNSKNINFTNVISKNNNVADEGDCAGIRIAACTNLKFTSCQFYDERILTSTEITFVDGGAGADTITHDLAQFLTSGFVAGQSITITGSTSNNVTKTIVSVVAGTITLATGSLTAEAAGDTVTITQAAMQDYGLKTTAGPSTVELLNCKLLPNISSGVSNQDVSTIISLTGAVNEYAAVAGDILYHNGTNWVRLAKGTAGQVLTMNGGATAPVWATP
jgi:hypothetical protein